MHFTTEFPDRFTLFRANSHLLRQHVYSLESLHLKWHDTCQLHKKSRGTGNEILAFIEGWPYLKGVDLYYESTFGIPFKRDGLILEVTFTRGSTVCSPHIHVQPLTYIRTYVHGRNAVERFLSTCWRAVRDKTSLCLGDTCSKTYLYWKHDCTCPVYT